MTLLWWAGWFGTGGGQDAGDRGQETVGSGSRQWQCRRRREVGVVEPIERFEQSERIESLESIDSIDSFDKGDKVTDKATKWRL